MAELLRFLQQSEIWIYALGGLIALFYLRKMLVSWPEWRGARFGIERETAQRRFSAALSGLILVVVFVLAEFILVSFVSPGIPQANVIPTPTLDLLTTAITAPAAGGETTPEATAGVIALSTVTTGQCVPGQIEWTEPFDGAEISETVTLKGTVNVSDFGFYKYEYSQPGSSIWSTIAAGNKPVTNDQIGVWNTTQMTPGDYLLRLVVVDNQNNALPGCVIAVRITQ